MYIPRPFHVDDSATLLAFMRDHPFATVITPTSGAPAATHIPVLAVCDGDDIRIRAHMARANDHSNLLDGDASALIAFHGPHAYVSPFLCGPGAGPTWYYIAVHASGPVRTLAGDDAHEFLHELIAAFDPDFRAAWDDADEGLRARMVAGIVPSEMDVTGWGQLQAGSEPGARQPRADRGASHRVDGHERRSRRPRHERPRQIGAAPSGQATDAHTLWPCRRLRLAIRHESDSREPGGDGAPGRNRTCDPVIRSHLLYPLSYGRVVGCGRPRAEG